MICFLYTDCMEGFMINEKNGVCQFCIMGGIYVEMNIRIWLVIWSLASTGDNYKCNSLPITNYFWLFSTLWWKMQQLMVTQIWSKLGAFLVQIMVCESLCIRIHWLKYLLIKEIIIEISRWIDVASKSLSKQMLI